VDLVLVETMCASHEALAAAAAAQEMVPGKWGISFCLAPGEPGVLLDGTLLADLLPELGRARFIGINCVAAPTMTGQVQHLHSLLNGDVPIAAYGNVGHPDDERGWVNTDAIDPDRYAEHSMEWVEAGASIIGGCCGTTPETTKAMSNQAT
jgi:S-methylmethionine-dependent homocysteine/selenocysteine methylase